MEMRLYEYSVYLKTSITRGSNEFAGTLWNAIQYLSQSANSIAKQGFKCTVNNRNLRHSIRC